MINIIIIMTKYKIKPYSYEQAKKIGVDIEPSTNPKYKIDIYTKEGQYITSIGARGYSDYPTFIEEDGKLIQARSLDERLFSECRARYREPNGAFRKRR